MAFNLEKTMENPEYGREENRLYVKHPKIGDGQKYYYFGKGIESMPYNIAVESTERNTIAEKKPITINKAGGITFPSEFEIKEKGEVYEALYAMALLDKINEEFDVLLVFGNMGVKQSGTLVEDAVFAKSSKAKFTVSSIAGDGTQPIKVSTEGKTSGDVLNGYVEVAGFTSEPETWAQDSFTEVAGLEIGDVILLKPAA